MKTKIVVLILTLIVITSVILPIKSLGFDWSEKFSSIDSAANNETGDQTAFLKVINAIFSIVRIVGTGVAIIMLIVLATKYMVASAGEKADIKKHAVVYVVGAVLLFGAAQILGIIQDFALKNI